MILGSVHQLLDSPGLESQDRTRARVIERNALQLLARVNDLLEAARFGTDGGRLAYVEVDLDALLRLTADSFASLAQQRGLAFEVQSDVRIPAELDRDKVQRVVMNLLANAFKFTPAGGSVVLRASREEPNETVLIEVADTGIGIPEADRELVFDRYRQADHGDVRRYGGTGLGLSIAREIVTAHGGEIGVADTMPLGTTMWVRLPLRAPGEAHVDRDPAESLPVPDAPLIAATLTPLPDVRAFPDGPGDQAPLVLVVDDNPDMNVFIAQVLADTFRTVPAFDGREGLEVARSSVPDVVITDAMMPGMSGERFVQELRADARLDAVPVLMLTAKSDQDFEVRMLERGVNDFLTKPFAPEVLRARVGALQRAKVSGDLHRRRAEALSKSEAEVKAQLRWRSLHDDVTGLPGRDLLVEHLERLFADPARPGVGLAVLDLDQFEIINGTYGHEAAQALLVEVSRRLTAHVRRDDMVASLGRDTFALTAAAAATPESLPAFATRLVEIVAGEVFAIGDDLIGVTACFGLASTGMGLQTAEELIRAAAVAVDRAKAAGRNRFAAYDASFTRDATARLRADADVRGALAHGWLAVHYQPIIDVIHGATWGCEALARIAHPRGELLAPGSFIEAAELSGLIVPLGTRVLQEACRQLATWHAAGADDLRMTVNLSGRQAREPDLLSIVDDAIGTAGISPHHLCLEITESSVVGSTSPGD